jgi:hypothetical protein
MRRGNATWGLRDREARQEAPDRRLDPPWDAGPRETLGIMMAGGGYCLAPTQQIRDNTPAQNVLPTYETARRYGTHPH